MARWFESNQGRIYVGDDQLGVARATDGLVYGPFFIRGCGETGIHATLRMLCIMRAGSNPAARIRTEAIQWATIQSKSEHTMGA